jgi:hypothetical protein
MDTGKVISNKVNQMDKVNGMKLANFQLEEYGDKVF